MYIDEGTNKPFKIKINFGQIKKMKVKTKTKSKYLTMMRANPCLSLEVLLVMMIS
jgi:hypothetical protein